MAAGAGGVILVVDDNAGIRRTLQLLLEPEGYTVLSAANGREALAWFDRVSPNLVFLDLHMPVMTGWEVFTAMRHQGIAVPVVFMSAGTNAQVEAVAYGADAYLAKPFDLDVLLQLVARFSDTLEPSDHKGGDGVMPATPTPVAIINSSDTILRLLRDIVKEAGFDCITTKVEEAGRTVDALQAFLDRHKPKVVLYDVSAPYPESWELYRALKDTETRSGSGRRFVLTTQNKAALEEHVGRTDAIELVGDRLDRERIARAIQRAVAV